jgi:hypothetical protein
LGDDLVAEIDRVGHGPDKELALYTSDGDVLRDGRDMQILAQDWHEWEMGDDARRKGATSLSMILSMPTGTDPEQVKEAALAFAREEFANRSWVASPHSTSIATIRMFTRSPARTPR